MTFFCRESFLVAPLYKSSRVTGSWCTVVFPTVRQARRDYEEQIAENIKTHRKSISERIISRKPARETLGPLDDQGAL